jgi:hypothetical protein
MGAWGIGILENDTSADAYGDYVNHMNAGLSPAEALAKIHEGFGEDLKDPEDAAYVWLGVAKAQWEYGHITEEMIRRVTAIATLEAHLAEWDEPHDKGLKKRKRVIETFTAKLRSPNPSPKKPRKSKLRHPIYEPGTCLAIARPDGRFLAGLVTFPLIEDASPGQDTYGVNSVALLDFLEPTLPELRLFKARSFVREESTTAVKAWLPIVYGCYASYHRSAKPALNVVGTIARSRADALLPTYAVRWDFPHAEMQIERWRANRDRGDILIADRLEDLPEWRKILADIDAIIHRDNPGRLPRPTIEQRLDLSSLKRE